MKRKFVDDLPHWLEPGPIGSGSLSDVYGLPGSDSSMSDPLMSDSSGDALGDALGLDTPASKRSACAPAALAGQPTLDAFLGLRTRPLMRAGLGPPPAAPATCAACARTCDEYDLQPCTQCAHSVCSLCSVRYAGVRCLDC